jgi:hypothetical protein
MSSSFDTIAPYVDDDELVSEELLNRVTNSESNEFLQEMRKPAMKVSEKPTTKQNLLLLKQTKPSPSSLSKPEDFMFPESNMSIRVTGPDGTVIQGRVCSQVMSLFSPVWRRLVLNISDNDSKTHRNLRVENELFHFDDADDQHGDGCLDFTADNHGALQILLNIAHLNTRAVARKELEYKDLLNMAELIHKYDCLSRVEIFHKGWLAGQEFQAHRDGMENWLFIAWVFSRRQVFKDLAEKLVAEISISCLGTPVTATGSPLKGPFPDGIIGEFLSLIDT